MKIGHNLFQEKVDRSLVAGKANKILRLRLVVIFVHEELFFYVIYILSDCDVREIRADELQLLGGVIVRLRNVRDVQVV